MSSILSGLNMNQINSLFVLEIWYTLTFKRIGDVTKSMIYYYDFKISDFNIG